MNSNQQLLKYILLTTVFAVVIGIFVGVSSAEAQSGNPLADKSLTELNTGSFEENIETTHSRQNSLETFYSTNFSFNISLCKPSSCYICLNRFSVFNGNSKTSLYLLYQSLKVFD